jgi:hypothetical protein
MSSRTATILVLVLIGWSCCAASADVVRVSSAQNTLPPAPPSVSAGDTRLEEINWLLRDGRECQPEPMTQGPVAERQISGGVACEVPTAPSSLALAASALASLGAFHGLRCLRKLNFAAGSLPDWYHTGGPVQIGHATPFDLEFGALAVCAFDEPVSRPTMACRAPRAGRFRLRSQFSLLIESPRAPPAQA